MNRAIAFTIGAYLLLMSGPLDIAQKFALRGLVSLGRPGPGGIGQTSTAHPRAGRQRGALLRNAQTRDYYLKCDGEKTADTEVRECIERRTRACVVGMSDGHVDLRPVDCSYGGVLWHRQRSSRMRDRSRPDERPLPPPKS